MRRPASRRLRESESGGLIVLALVAVFVLSIAACSFRDFESLTDRHGEDANDGGPTITPDGGPRDDDAALPNTDGGTADESLIGWWKLDEIQGTLANDSSGRGNHGRVDGTVEWVMGRVGGAAKFGGAAGILISDSPSLRSATTALTVAFWIFAEDLPAIDERIIKMGYVWEVKLNGAERRPHFQAGGNGGRFARSSLALPLGSFHHIAFTFNQGAVTTYFDGAPQSLEDSSFTDTAPLGTDTFGLALATTVEKTDHCKCMLDDVRVYSRSLAAQEIAVLAGK